MLTVRLLLRRPAHRRKLWENKGAAQAGAPVDAGLGSDERWRRLMATARRYSGRISLWSWVDKVVDVRVRRERVL